MIIKKVLIFTMSIYLIIFGIKMLCNKNNNNFENNFLNKIFTIKNTYRYKQLLGIINIFIGSIYFFLYISILLKNIILIKILLFTIAIISPILLYKITKHIKFKNK